MPELTTKMMRDAIAKALWAAMSASALERFCTTIGLAPPAAGDEAYASKRSYVIRRLIGMGRPELVKIGRRVLDECDSGSDSAQALAALLGGLGGGVAGEMKNLIFAADGPKPEFVFSDAINNDLVVVKNDQFCLIYDEPLDPDGLTWRQLGEWWARRERMTAAADVDVWRSLHSRLQRSLGTNGAELRVFGAYARRYRELGPNIPALLPQVYLHYDPYTRAHRGSGLPPLARQRMDFLLLLPNRVRVVIECDGVQHYADGGGSADPRRYAEMVAEDRALRLRGYEVYRFGGYELQDPDGKGTVERRVSSFFDALAELHGSQNSPVVTAVPD